MTRRKTSRPKPFPIGPVRVRAIRGPKGERWYWRAQVYDGKRGRTVWRGWATEAEVTREVAAIVGADRLDAPQDRDTLTTVRDLMECWVVEQDERLKRGDIRPRSHKLYELAARRISHAIGSTPIRRTGISIGALERFRDRKLDEGISRLRIAYALKRLGSAWRWARRHGLVPPVDLPTLVVKVPEPERHTPTIGDVHRVLGRLQGWSHFALLMLLHTGMRIGEVAALRWKDVDLERSTLSVRGGKTGDRSVPLAAVLHEALLEASRLPSVHPDGRVLGVSEETILGGVGRRVRRACAELGVTPFTPHGCRRLMCDNLLRQGVDVGTAASITGHSPVVLLRYYRQATADDRRLAITAVAALSVDNVVAFPRRG